MANTERLQASYESHRQEQIAIRAAFLAQFVQSWDLLSEDDLDGTFPLWFAAVLLQIRYFRDLSATKGLQQYGEIRLLAAPKALEAPIPALPEINWSSYDQMAHTALKSTGPDVIKASLKRGLPPQAARDKALVTSSGYSSRAVLTGDRVTTLTAVENDPEAVGWARVSDKSPCYRCALYISRGPVYKSQQSASFSTHDHCACKPVPVFSKGAAWPGNAREIRRFYNEAVADATGGENRVLAFRRAWESRRAVERVAQ
jgi:hypothetical protein